MVCSPPENWLIRFFLSSFGNPKPVKSVSYSRSYSNRSLSKVSRQGHASRSSSSTVRFPSLKACWESIPTVSRREHRIPAPSRLSSRSRESFPATRFNRVVLPAPFLPTTAIFSLPRISKSMWDKISSPPTDTVPFEIWYNMTVSSVCDNIVKSFW